VENPGRTPVYHHPDRLSGVARRRDPSDAVHVIEEYARHNGQADLLRERIDEKLGQ
jgi:hypothetical protein